VRSLLLSFYLLSADQADYDGKNLIFSGKFQVDHPMGVLQAEKATLRDLQLHRPEKKGSHLTLENGVSISVKRSKTPFSIRSLRAICELPPTSLFPLFQFQELQFFDDVEIQTTENISARGGSAVYKIGSLTLYPAIPTARCQLLRNQDRIEANEIRFDLLKEELHCKGAQGSLLPSSQELPLRFAANELLWKKQEAELFLEEEVSIEQENRFSVHSDRAFLSLGEEKTPRLFLLENNVRLYSSSIQGKESFSIADRVSFSPQEGTIVLSASFPKRVLFWQEGLNLSAPEISIKKDPATKKETIEGKGDVHFAFDTEEKNIIEQLLSKYL
jgi:lipopolysaccharide export system protein LptA